MSIGWILLGLVAVGVAAVFVYALMKAASNAERAIRRARWDNNQFLDMTITTSSPGSQ